MWKGQAFFVAPGLQRAFHDGAYPVQQKEAQLQPFGDARAKTGHVHELVECATEQEAGQRG